MTPYDAAELLVVRRGLTGEVFTQPMVTSWAQALIDVTYDDALAALTALAADPTVGDIAVPQIRGWLRNRFVRAKQTESMKPVTYGCGCTFLELCETHRSVGLTAIDSIRSERGWTKPVLEPEIRYSPATQEDS